MLRAATYKTPAETDHRTIDGTVHSEYRRELQVVLSQYYEEVLGCKGAGGLATPLPLKYRRSGEPPPPAPRSGDGRGDGDVRPQRQPPPRPG